MPNLKKESSIVFKKNKSGGGFTLIEILVYIAVLVIITAAVSSFLSWSMKSNAKTKAMREVLDNTRRAMEIIGYEIREAKSVYAPTTTSTQLSLETIRYLPTGENKTYIDFYLCGAASTTLCLKKESQDPITFTSETVEVKKLEFSQVAATSTFPSIQINLQIDYKNPNNKPEFQSSINTTSTVSLRSY